MKLWREEQKTWPYTKLWREEQKTKSHVQREEQENMTLYETEKGKTWNTTLYENEGKNRKTWPYVNPEKGRTGKPDPIKNLKGRTANKTPCTLKPVAFAKQCKLRCNFLQCTAKCTAKCIAKCTAKCTAKYTAKCLQIDANDWGNDDR